jgi:hypothetical protein
LTTTLLTTTTTTTTAPPTTTTTATTTTGKEKKTNFRTGRAAARPVRMLRVLANARTRSNHDHAARLPSGRGSLVGRCVHSFHGQCAHWGLHLVGLGQWFSQCCQCHQHHCLY